MVNKKKIIAVGGVSFAALSAVCAGSFAFFSDTSEKAASATAGLVDISMSDVTITNPDNINPGDNDPDNPDGHRPGTPHDVTFSMTNDGNKSIMTRNVITISVKDTGNNLVDPSVYRLLNTQTHQNDNTAAFDAETPDSVEVAGKLYGDSKGNFTAEKPADCKYIRYITNQVALNGKADSVGREDENVPTGELWKTNGNGVTVNENGDGASFFYQLMMDHSAPDTPYEKSVIEIQVDIQAIQYRNSSNGTFTTVFSDMKKLNN